MDIKSFYQKYKHNRQLTVIYHDTFADCDIATCTVPYNPRRAMFGYYSSLFKDFKDALIEVTGIEGRLIKTHIKRFKGASDRISIKLHNGAELDMPAELTKKDLDIIGLHLKAAEIRFS